MRMRPVPTFLVGALALVPATLLGQNGSIRGRVTDASGAALARACSGGWCT